MLMMSSDVENKDEHDKDNFDPLENRRVKNPNS
jgi:hypothetical protein